MLHPSYSAIWFSTLVLQQSSSFVPHEDLEQNAKKSRHLNFRSIQNLTYGSVTIDTSWIQHGYGQRVMTIWSAVPHVIQSAPHVVGALSLLHPHVLWLVLLMYSSCYLPYGLHIGSPLTSIYSIDTILYPYALPLLSIPLTSLKPLPKCNLSSSLRS